MHNAYDGADVAKAQLNAVITNQPEEVDERAILLFISHNSIKNILSLLEKNDFTVIEDISCNDSTRNDNTLLNSAFVYITTTNDNSTMPYYCFAQK